MTLSNDDPTTQRLLRFCSRLPELQGEPQQLQGEVQFVLSCFSRQREALASRISRCDALDDLASLRCELEAVDAASSVLAQLWQRRFGTTVPPAEASSIH